MKVKGLSSIAVVCCFICPWQGLAAEDETAQNSAKPQARSVSPDGKWELHAGAHENDDFVIAKAGSNETSVVLSEEEYVDGLAEAMGRAPGYAMCRLSPRETRWECVPVVFRMTALCAASTPRCLSGSSW